MKSYADFGHDNNLLFSAPNRSASAPRTNGHLVVPAGKSRAAKSCSSCLTFLISSIRLSVSRELATVASLTPAWRAQA